MASYNVSCPDIAKECLDQSLLKCHNGGLCCQVLHSQETFCAQLDWNFWFSPPTTSISLPPKSGGLDKTLCPPGYSDEKCIVKDFDHSGDWTMRIIGLSSAISIAVGIIALVALGVITLVIVRNYRKRRPWGFGPLEREPDLDTTIIFVQEEISKLSTVQQLSKLQRLSKMFEKTVRDAILSEPSERIEAPESVVMNQYLPRWSSAPTCINRPPNDIDVTDGPDDVFKKQRLQAVFSLQ